MNKPNFGATVRACYLGNFVQAIVINVTPILFLTLQTQYALTYEQLGRLVLINFVTQVIVDLACSRPVDKYGMRPFLVIAHCFAAVGMVLFAAAPFLFSNPYTGFMVATILFAGGGGLLELLLSPVVASLPAEEAAGAMSILHSFYSWGQVTAVLVTTLILWALRALPWNWILVGWAIIPVINAINFARVPLMPPIPDGKRTKLRKLLRSPYYIGILLCIALGGASELILGQWTSSFMEQAMGLPKMVGDVGGVCLFAAMMGVGRYGFGKYGAKIRLERVMTLGAVGVTLAYLIVAFSPWAPLSLFACALCGLCVSMLWPGSVSLAVGAFPLAGASMFALLSASGDTGASAGPWLAGVVTDAAQALGYAPDAATGLRIAMALSAILPVLLFCVLIWMQKSKAKFRAREEGNEA